MTNLLSGYQVSVASRSQSSSPMAPHMQGKKTTTYLMHNHFSGRNDEEVLSSVEIIDPVNKTIEVN